jgi:hypothetical protein
MAGIVILAGLAFGGCSKVGDAVRGFTGGSDSADKKDAVPAAAKAQTTTPVSAPAPIQRDDSAAPAPAGDAASSAALPSALADPAVASKADTAIAYSSNDPVEGKTSLRQSMAAYKAQGWRDPFVSLVSSEKRDMRSDKVDLSVVTLVAIVTGSGDTFCVVEDGEGTSYILREGDTVRNGRVLRIGATTVTASQTILGYTTQVQLELIERKDVKNG